MVNINSAADPDPFICCRIRRSDSFTKIGTGLKKSRYRIRNPAKLLNRLYTQVDIVQYSIFSNEQFCHFKYNRQGDF